MTGTGTSNVAMPAATPGRPLAGMVAVVTGASRGLGRGFAVALAAAGADLIVNATNAAALEDLAVELRVRFDVAVRTVDGSVADDDVAARIVGAAVDTFGKLDILVNNAGITRDRSALKMTVDEFDEVVAVNLRGAWSCGRHAAAAMRAAGGGVILNVVSEVAFYGAFGQSNYAATKAGLVALTLAWSVEFARFGIRVNAFSPAALTEMSQVVIDRAAIIRGPDAPPPDPADWGMGAVDDIGPLVVYLAGSRAKQQTGQIFSFNGRHLGVWSHPATVSVAERPTWSADDIADAFDAGELTPQGTHRPTWAP